MYGITAHYRDSGDGSGEHIVRSGNGRVTVHAFDHSAGDAAVAAIYEHVAAYRDSFRHLAEGGARLVFGTLPTASGRDGDTFAAWIYPDSWERTGNVPR